MPKKRLGGVSHIVQPLFFEHVPRLPIRKRRIENDLFHADRMEKFHPQGVEGDHPAWKRRIRTIFDIPKDGAPDECEMCPDLMGASGFRIYPHKMVCADSLDDFPLGSCPQTRAVCSGDVRDTNEVA